MIEINLFEMLAAAEHEETDAEKIAFKDIPGAPIKGLKPETDDGQSSPRTSARAVLGDPRACAKGASESP